MLQTIMISESDAAANVPCSNRDHETLSGHLGVRSRVVTSEVRWTVLAEKVDLMMLLLLLS